MLKDLVAKHLPKIHEHMEDVGIELEALSFGWFLSLFSMALPIRTLLRMLDVFFVDGAIVLFVSFMQPRNAGRFGQTQVLLSTPFFCSGSQRLCCRSTPKTSWPATMLLTYTSLCGRCRGPFIKQIGSFQYVLWFTPF